MCSASSSFRDVFPSLRWRWRRCGGTRKSLRRPVLFHVVFSCTRQTTSQQLLFPSFLIPFCRCFRFDCWQTAIEWDIFLSDGKVWQQPMSNQWSTEMERIIELMVDSVYFASNGTRVTRAAVYYYSAAQDKFTSCRGRLFCRPGYDFIVLPGLFFRHLAQPKENKNRKEEYFLFLKEKKILLRFFLFSFPPLSRVP